MNQKSNASLLPVYFVLFIDNFAFAVIFAIFGPLFVDPSFKFVSAETSMAIRDLMLGAALALFPLGQLIGAPLLGDIADRFGRKKAFYITILGAAIGITLSGFSIMIHSFTLLILTRLITGFFSGNLSICLASIADLSPDEKTRAKNFSIIIIITGISWMIAILSGSLFSNKNISQHFNPALPFFITAILFIITLLMIIYFFKETHKTAAKFHINLLQKFHTSSVTVNWGLFIVGITWMFGGYTVNNFLIKRWHARPLIVVGNALTTLCVLGMAFSESFYPFAIFFGIGCIPSAFAWPNMINLISINAPENIQGKIMGISQSFQALGLIFATVFGGIVAGISLKSIYYFATFFVFIGFILILFKHMHMKKATP